MGEQRPLDPDPAVRMPALKSLRAECPVVPPTDAASPWLAVSHAAVAEGLGRIEDFGSSAGQAGLAEEDTTIAAIAEPRHSQIRRIINSVVALHKSQRIEPFLDELTKRLTDELADASLHAGPDGIDVMPILVDAVPPSAIARLLGFPVEDAGRYYGWADDLGANFAKAIAERRSISMVEACPALATYVEDRIAGRLALPVPEWPDDALSRLLSTEVDGVTLSCRSIRIQIMFMIGAGSETTRNLIGSLLYRLAVDPDAYSSIRADRRRVDQAVEETLRIDSPAQFLVRGCVQHAELDGIRIQAGERVMLSIASANRDEKVFPHPDRFDIERVELRDHLAFGTGAHICPGAALARLEARCVLNAVLDRFETIRPARGFAFDHLDHAMLHGPKTLRLVMIQAS